MKTIEDKIILSGYKPSILFNFQSVLTFQDRDILPNSVLIKQFDDEIIVSEEFNRDDLEEAIGNMISEIVSNPPLNNYFIVVYKLGQEIPRMNAIICKFSVMELQVPVKNFNELLELNTLLEYIKTKEPYLKDEDLLYKVKNIRSETEFFKKVEEVMGNKLDLIKYYRINILKEDIEISSMGSIGSDVVEIRMHGSNDIRIEYSGE